MRTSNSKYLLCFLCFVVTLACSFITTPPLKLPRPFPTDTNIPLPAGPTEMAPVPIAEPFIPSTDACDILAGESFTEIDDLHLLPAKIQTVFDYPIANKGEPFNATDVIDLTKPLPGARFAIAGISARYALIAVERGGVAHSLETSLYYSASRELQFIRNWSLPAYPAYLNDLGVLKTALCK